MAIRDLLIIIIADLIFKYPFYAAKYFGTCITTLQGLESYENKKVLCLFGPFWRSVLDKASNYPEHYFVEAANEALGEIRIEMELWGYSSKPEEPEVAPPPQATNQG